MPDSREYQVKFYLKKQANITYKQLIDGHTDFVSQGTCGTGKVFVLYLKIEQ